MLTLPRYLALAAEQGELLARAVEIGSLDAPVDACPGWTLADLGYHVGDVMRFWSWVVTTGATSTDGEPEFPRPPDEELVQWIRDGVRELNVHMREADPRAPAYSWTPQRNVAFVQRRVPHELAVHRWDAQHAIPHELGVEAQAIPSDLATDGVSEYFLLGSSWPVTQESLGARRIRLRCTDSGAVWTAGLHESLLRAGSGDETSKVSVTVSGAASDLLLALWRRLPEASGRLVVDGDRSAVAAFLSLANLD
jgi:uncharacterized protein (TIGR03083 family)